MLSHAIFGGKQIDLLYALVCCGRLQIPKRSMSLAKSIAAQARTENTCVDAIEFAPAYYLVEGKLRFEVQSLSGNRCSDSFTVLAHLDSRPLFQETCASEERTATGLEEHWKEEPMRCPPEAPLRE